MTADETIWFFRPFFNLLAYPFALIFEADTPAVSSFCVPRQPPASSSLEEYSLRFCAHLSKIILIVRLAPSEAGEIIASMIKSVWSTKYLFFIFCLTMCPFFHTIQKLDFSHVLHSLLFKFHFNLSQVLEFSLHQHDLTAGGI